jgi:hypothetical protein
MADKMFYSLAEVCDKLNMTEEQVKDLVRNGQLREFRDAGKVNYKGDEIDALVAAAGTGALAGSGELVLEPADDSGAGALGSGSGIDLAASGGLGSDVLTLDEADLDDTAADTKAGEVKKDDTVVSSVGVNVFDDEEELQDVDPLAQTVVTEGAAGLGIEGIGSGSGLLDLTKESDDTSFGMDLLQELAPGDDAPVEMGEDTLAGLDAALPADEAETASEGSGEGTGILEAGLAEEAVGPTVRTRTIVEYGPDAISTGFTGMIVVGVAVMCVAGLSSASIMQGVWPSILDLLHAKLWIFGLASAGLAGVATAVGFFLGKRSQS